MIRGTGYFELKHEIHEKYNRKLYNFGIWSSLNFALQNMHHVENYTMLNVNLL